MGETSTNFATNGQDVYGSCGVTFHNKQYIFGGREKETYRQVLQIEDCGLVNIGSIPFDLTTGACDSTASVMVLCFHYWEVNDLKRCRKASSPYGPWTLMALSTYAHQSAKIATSSGNK